MKKGFTLIETVIYIALFSIIMTGGFITAYQLIQGNDALATRTTTGEEGSFVSKKLEWALTGMSNDPADLVSPSATSSNATSSRLSIEKWSAGAKIPVMIAFDAAGGSILMGTAGGPMLHITTSNVNVSSLTFTYIPSQGKAPFGIKAVAKIDGTDFTITQYARK